MSVMFIANNCTRESGSFMGDQLCSLKTAYLFVQNQPDVTQVVISMSPGNEMNFLWTKFIEDPKGDGTLPPVKVIWDNWNPGDWSIRHSTWDRWRSERHILLESESDESDGLIRFDHYRELYLRIHGAQRQNVLCQYERGLGRKNIYEYWYYGQEHSPEGPCIGSDWFDSSLIHHPPLTRSRDVYISPHCKTQGNLVFTFDYWQRVATLLCEYGLTVTLGYDGAAGPFHDQHLLHLPNYKRYWGDHKQWMYEVCNHKVVACGNTGTGWLAAACGVPMITMEPHNSVMIDHRYRECGLKNIIEVIDGNRLDQLHNNTDAVAEYCVKRILDHIKHRVVFTTGCYDIIHSGHIRHLEESKSLGTKLIVALNSDESVSSLKGTTRPINKQKDRKKVLEALRCVDEVRIFDGPNALHLIEEIKPDIITAGPDYNLDTIIGKDIIEGYGGAVHVTCMDSKKVHSTTQIVNKIAAIPHHKVSQSTIRDICHSASPYSVNSVNKLILIANEFLRISHLDGDIADMGTCKGGTALILRRLAPDKHLHLFDTWQGNPYNEEDCHHKIGEWITSLEECRKIVGTDYKTYYHPGTFPQEKPEYSDELKFCFVYVDMDLYQSTLDTIEFFWPRLVPGGIMVFDDYDWTPCPGVKRAIQEFQIAQSPIDFNPRVISSLYTYILEKR